ncbi:hypothetical protein EIP91_007363 [Steccherinum ochraceum]|uniref:Uncharacterized protein n=1 Tax=Steccherinum ochraceum TaxID=92696 RepID=A0A4R0RUC1_9APHY|nr:hypothetical protein EIP91_007363 [Steccherinum ochraceum]
MSVPPLPNPLTPLAWLPPDIAFQFEVSRYIAAVTAGAWFWDIVMALKDEIRLFRRQIRAPDVVYIFARVGVGCFVLTSFIFDVAPVGNCESFVKAIGWIGALAIPLNSLLFLFRIHAIFEGRRDIVGLFTFFWVAVVACSLTAPFSLDGIRIGETMYCTFGRVRPYGSAGIVTSAINDTLVFLAITIKLILNTPAKNSSERMRTLFSGKGMGNISRAVMQGGQQYYLTAAALNIIAATAILAPSVPVAYGNVLAVPNGALQNAMAALVYRQLKLGYLRDVGATDMPPKTLTLRFSTSALPTDTTRSHREESRPRVALELNERMEGYRHHVDEPSPILVGKGSGWNLKPGEIV